MQFQQDCPKDKKIYSSFNFLPENLEKLHSTELYGAALEGSTIFLCRSSLGCTSMESCELADLKYAIFSRTRCKTKKLPRSKLFLSMVFKHGLQEGWTFLFHYNNIRHTTESSRLGQLNYAISARQDVRSKKKTAPSRGKYNEKL